MKFVLSFVETFQTRVDVLFGVVRHQSRSISGSLGSKKFRGDGSGSGVFDLDNNKYGLIES